MLKTPIKQVILISFALILTSCSENITQPSLSDDAVVLAFGDSLTYGTGSSPENAYPSVLAKIIQREVINAGIPGEISKEGLSRLPALIKKHQPELIILCHGGNDILRKINAEVTKENLQLMINLAQKNNINVVLIAVPKFGVFLNPLPIYQELADSNKLAIENNTLPDILTKKTLKSDHIHPNAQGYQQLAEAISHLLMDTGIIVNPIK